MTTANDTKAQAKADREARAKDMEQREAKLNEGKTGKGLRKFLGLTRGKNPVEIEYEGFDVEKPETLPETVKEFIDLTGTTDDKVYLSYLINGYNDAMYTAASDPIAEFIDAGWSDELQKGFRSAVRSYSQNAKVSIEDAVALIKPGIAAAHAKATATA